MIDQEDFDDTFSIGQFRIDPWLLTDLDPEFTGVDTMIWVSMQQKGLKPIVIVDSDEKINKHYDVIVTLYKPYRILASEGGKISYGVWRQLIKWINLNHRALMRHWNGLTSTPEVFKELKKI